MSNRGYVRPSLALALTAALAVPAVAGDDTLTYTPGKGVSIRTDDGMFRLDMSTRGQARLTWEDPDDGDTDASFRARRLKFKLQGHAYEEWLQYKVQFDFTGKSGGGDLEDLMIKAAFRDSVKLVVGQYKVPFSRQQVASSGKQQFVDRSIASNRFDLVRDVGMHVEGGDANEYVYYQVGLFNGEGRNNTNAAGVDSSAFLYVGRLGFSNGGGVDHAESDLANRDDVHVDGSIAYALNSELDGDPDRDVSRLTADFGLKYRGFSTVLEYHQETDDKSSTYNGLEVDADGGYVQAGYFVIPKRFEIALRHSMIDPNTDIGNDEQSETRLGFNVLWKGHGNKLQFDVGRLTTEVPGMDDIDATEIRGQYQIIF